MAWHWHAVFEQLLQQKIPTTKDEVLVNCPFHKDKNPSMSINLDKGVYNCFACGAKGNVYQLASQYGYRIDDSDNLVAKGSQTQPKQKPKYIPYTIADYGREKKLDSDFLSSTFKLETEKNYIKIPYFDIDSSLLYNKYRGVGKKMWSDKSITVQPYGLWLLNSVRDKSVVWIVEGESDTQTLWQNGIPAIGIPGVESLKPSFLNKILSFKDWVFVSESDAGGLEFVKNVYQILIDYYYDKIQNSYFVLPSDMNRKDINDIWVANPNKKQFINKMNRLLDIKIQASIAYEDIIHKTKWFDKDIRRVSVALYQDVHAVYDDDDIFYDYDSSKMKYYVVKDEQRWFRRFMTSKGISKVGKQQQVRMQLETFIKNKRKPKQVSSDWVFFKNVAVNYKTLEITDKFNSEEYFVLSRIPIDYYNDSSQASELVDSLFNDWVDNPQDLFDIIGYTFVRKYPENKMIILYGVGGNGKTTFLNILENVLNGLNELNREKNTAHVELKMLLEDRFSRASLYNKYANIAGEMDYNTMNDTTPIKMLTGDGELDAQYKYGQTFSFLNYAKLIFATNKIPSTIDTSTGFFRRVAIVKFKQIDGSKKDPLILEKLTQKDYEYIAYKSLIALHNLYKNRFAIAGDENKMKDMYLTLSNTVRMFIAEQCEVTRDENDYIPVSEFKMQLNKWVLKHRYPVVKAIDITNEMESIGIEKDRRRTSTSQNPVHIFIGIRFKVDENVSEIPF